MVEVVHLVFLKRLLMATTKINCGKMWDTDDDDALFALMSAVSATTLIIILVADADATKHKRRPRRKHRAWV